MKTVEINEATEPLGDYARHIGEEPVIVTVDGKPVAALVSVEDLDPETVSLSLNPKFMAIIERSRKRLKDEGGISSQEMRQRLGL